MGTLNSVLSSQLGRIGLSQSQSSFSFHEGSDTVDHVLDEVLLGSAKSSQVGDVEHAIIGLGMLAMDASDLYVVLLCNCVELVLVIHQLRQLDVHRGTHCSSQVGWARCDVAEVVVVGELEVLLNLGGSSLKSAEDSLDVGTWLHRDDSKLVLLVDPDQECLLIIVEDASARWPVSVQVGSS